MNIFTQNLTLALSASSLSKLEGLGQQPAQGSLVSAASFNATAIRIDTVTLSPQAMSLAASRAGSSSDPAAATTPSEPAEPQASALSSRGAVLFDALDGDGDGTITRDEFEDGARTLLRRGPDRHSGRPHDVGNADRGHHYAYGLSNRLGRVFDHVDANEDGTVDKAELASALQGARSSGADEPSTAPDAAVTAVTQVTVVTLAIQQYTSLSFGDQAVQPETFNAIA